jgi:hypothetical protein
MRSRCTLCGSQEYRVLESAIVQPSQAEKLVVDLSALVGVKVAVHRLRLVECRSCVPGRVTRHRELVIPLEVEYGKGYLRSKGKMQ